MGHLDKLLVLSVFIQPAYPDERQTCFSGMEYKESSGKEWNIGYAVCISQIQKKYAVPYDAVARVF